MTPVQSLFLALVQICLIGSAIAHPHGAASHVSNSRSVNAVKDLVNVLDELVNTHLLNPFRGSQAQDPCIFDIARGSRQQHQLHKRQNVTDTTTPPVVTTTTPQPPTTTESPTQPPPVITTTSSVAPPPGNPPTTTTSASPTASPESPPAQSPVTTTPGSAGPTTTGASPPVNNNGPTTTSVSPTGNAPAPAPAPAPVTSTTAPSTNAGGQVVTTTPPAGATTTSPAVTTAPESASSFTGEINVATTDDQGQSITLSSVSYGEVVTTTNARGHTFVTTFTPRAGRISRIVLQTTTLPDGVRSTITSYAEVTGVLPAATTNRGPTTTSSAVLQTNAATTKSPLLGELALLAGGVWGMAHFL